MNDRENGIAERFAFARALVAEAGDLAMDYFGRLATLDIRRKGARDVVSDADTAVEDLIRRRLAEAWPTDGFLGEETGLSEVEGATGIWVVDPIDGTQPFVSGLRTWCISVAYVRDATVQLGLVNNPAARELFTGGRGEPATLNGRPIAPHPGTTFADGLVYVGASPRVTADDVVPIIDRLMRRGGMFVRSGSGALGLCDVACGRLIGYAEPHINAWDCLGAVGVLEAAGCRVNDYLGNDGLRVGGPIVAGPPAVFDELTRLLS